MATVLLTGGTGFVGGAVAFRLLHDERVDRLVLLARGAAGVAARDRLTHSVSRFGPLPHCWSSVEVVEGDLHSLALDRAMVDSVTHVIHAAACTSLRPRSDARSVNVLGSRALAEQMRRGRRLERFMFVSTAYRCGVVDRAAIDEDEPAALEHVADYTRSKAEAEDVLGAMKGLPLVVVRPSVVVGHSRLGVGPSASLFWYYRALAKSGISPFPEGKKRDIVPVDYVAEVMAHLAFRPTLRHGTYHIAAGESSSAKWGEIRSEFARLGAAPASAEYVTGDAFVRHAAWAALGGNHPYFRRAIEGCARFSVLPVEWFKNDRVLAEGVPPPPPFTSYLGRCLETSDRSILEQLCEDA